MKRQAIISFGILLSIVACNDVEHEEYTSLSRPKADLYQEAAEMKGLNIFIIGQTIIRDLSEINKEISQNNKYSILYEDGFREKEFARCCPDVKQFSISEYYIGDICINNVSLIFYKDTLFEINAHASDAIRDAFTQKYGEGVKDYLRHVERSKKKTKVRGHERIIWENESVIAKYDSEIDSFGEKIKHRSDFAISTKSATVISDINNCESAAKERIDEVNKKKRSNDLNKF